MDPDIEEQMTPDAHITIDKRSMICSFRWRHDLIQAEIKISSFKGVSKFIITDGVGTSAQWEHWNSSQHPPTNIQEAGNRILKMREEKIQQYQQHPCWNKTSKAPQKPIRKQARKTLSFPNPPSPPTYTPPAFEPLSLLKNPDNPDCLQVYQPSEIPSYWLPKSLEHETSLIAKYSNNPHHLDSPPNPPYLAGNDHEGNIKYVQLFPSFDQSSEEAYLNTGPGLTNIQYYWNRQIGSQKTDPNLNQTALPSPNPHTSCSPELKGVNKGVGVESEMEVSEKDLAETPKTRKRPTLPKLKLFRDLDKELDRLDSIPPIGSPDIETPMEIQMAEITIPPTPKEEKTSEDLWITPEIDPNRKVETPKAPKKMSPKSRRTPKPKEYPDFEDITPEKQEDKKEEQQDRARPDTPTTRYPKYKSILIIRDSQEEKK